MDNKSVRTFEYRVYTGNVCSLFSVKGLFRPNKSGNKNAFQ